MNLAIVLAGGKGLRMGYSIPKQFLLINDKPMIVQTLDAFNQCQYIDAICLVCLEEYKDEAKSLIEEYNLNKVKYIVNGGATRQESVYEGLKAFKENGADDEDVILIHDGARPFVSEEIILNNIRACRQYGSVCTVVKTTDSILISKDGNLVDDYLNRNELYNCQTPQTFKFKVILEAHTKANKKGINDATDDCVLVKRLNKYVYLVEGERTNIKITNPEDLKKQ